MLGTKSDKSSDRTRTAKAVFRAAMGKPLLVRRCVGVAAAITGLTVMTLAWDGPANVGALAQIAAPKSNGELGLPAEHEIQTFQRFAFNGLVLPLIDDAEPPRWTRHAVPWICDGRGDVKVNGKPLVDGGLVPQMFIVQWKLDRCAPLAGAELLVDGEISFAVSHDATGLHAQMVEHNLTAQMPAGARQQLPAIASVERSSVRAIASAP